LVLTLAHDEFTSPTELAIAHKLALLLRSVADKNPSWGLRELTRELTLISDNQRRFIGFSEDDSGFDPARHPGKVVVATMHKAKGLEWDRVYLLSVNNYDFPSGLDGDSFISEKWFLRNALNLEAEAVAQLQFLFERDEYSWYKECTPTEEARRKYVEERLRLLYVGVTRARQELVITWNTGRNGAARPALPLVALYNYWEDRSHADRA
jgi:DNA helicase-2/ATP-dependent DNA helicase PcrA